MMSKTWCSRPSRIQTNVFFGESEMVKGSIFPAAILAWGGRLGYCGDLVIPSGTTVSLAAGNFLVHNLMLGSHSRLIGKDGPVSIWYTGSLVVNSGAVLESETGEPTALMLYGQNGGSTEIKAEGKVAGLIYSPSQPFTLHSQGRLYGSVVSAQAEIKSNGQVHFDEALADGCAPSQSGDPPERGTSGKATPSESGRQ